MVRDRGCLKSGCMGCGILLGLLVVFAGVSALMAWRSVGDEPLAEVDSAPAAVERASALPAPSPGGGTPAVGRVVLNLQHHGFEIRPGEPGKGVYVTSRFDREVYELTDHFEPHADGTWTYHVDFRRTMPTLQAIFRAFMIDGGDQYVRIHLPPDQPLILELKGQQGGLEMDLGGLWITEADIQFRQGGIELDIGEPMREPMTLLSFKGEQGGANLNGIGNASPRTFYARWRMGGINVEMDGPWRNDADIKLALRMGGMSVRVPQDVDVRGTPVSGRGMLETDVEVPPPVLNFSVDESMGEVEILQR